MLDTGRPTGEREKRWRLTPHGWVYGNPRRGRRAVAHVPRTRTVPKEAQDWGKSWRLSPQNPHSFLEILADHLNDFAGLADEQPSDDQARALGAAWKEAEAIVSERNLSRAIKAFNRFAEPVAFRLQVDEGAENIRLSMNKGAVVLKRSGRREPWPVIVGPKTVQGQVARSLWEWFRDKGRRRLKPCSVCAKWFVDYARPGNSARCSKECTWRWWNRRRRKEAKHDSQKRRNTR